MKQRLLFSAIMVLLLIYSIPLWHLDYIIIDSDWFDLRADGLNSISKTFASGKTTLSEGVIRILTGIFTGGGLAYLSRKNASKQDKIFGWVIVVYVGVVLFLLWLSNYVIQIHREEITQDYTEELFNTLAKWTSDKFNELLIIFALTIGVKNQEILK